MIKNIPPALRQKALLALIPAVALLAVFVSIQSNRTPAPQEPLSVMTVAPGTMNRPAADAREGQVINATTVQVTSDHSGSITNVYVTEGQQVKAGQSLVLIQAVAEAVPAAPRQSSSQGQTGVEAAQKEVDRLQKLFDIGAIPRKQLDAAKERLAAARSGSSASSAAAVSSYSGPVTVKAATDGRVTGLAAAAGKKISAGQQLLSLGSGQDVEVALRLEPKDLNLVPLGSPVMIEAAGKSLAGQVTSIFPEVDNKQVPSFRVHIKLSANPDGALKPGMPANVRLSTGQSATVPAVPTSSLLQDSEGRCYVFLASGGKALRQEVQVGITAEGLTELLTALPPDSRIIVNNLMELKDGTPVILSQ